MFVHRKRGWELPEGAATPEAAVLARRVVLGGVAGTLAAGAALRPARAFSLFGSSTAAKPAQLKPLTAPVSAQYEAGRAVTAEKEATHYNNYYEFGMSKDVADEAAALPTEPWSIKIDGMVAKPRTVGVDELLKQVGLEQRVYRHRCVEAWAMTVPWTGIPLAAVVKMAEPAAGVKYVKFTTLSDEKVMPGLRQSWYPWPYTEGLTMQEAMNELSFLSVGMYGKTLPPQNGAPIRLTVPWKYGFKSAKSIVGVTFTNDRPKTFWEQLQESEYGFWANVNPAVPHPRWSQAREKLIGSGETVPTQIWNGYGPFVASMYDDKKQERLFV